MPVLLAILKIFGILLLVLLALLAVVLAMPVGIRFGWQGGQMQLSARFGPVKLCLWPRPAPKRPKAKEAPTAPPGPSGQTPPAAGAAAEPAAKQPKPAPKPPAKAADAPPPSPPPKPPAARPALPGFLQRRLDAVLALAKKDPLALVRCALGHLGFLTRGLLRGVRITGLTVFWTVHCEDASDTAVRYGALLAALNTLLVTLRQWMTIRAESLRLEPDFTGELAPRRQAAFCMDTRPGLLLLLMLRLVWRLWRDPLLQPRKETVS